MISEDSSFKIAAMGDIMLDRSVGEHFFSRPEDFEFKGLKPFLDKYDLRFANLENPVGLKGTPHPIQDPNVTFCCHPDTLQVLENLNIDIVSLANNHLLDYGETSLCETLEYLDEKGIKHFGAGRNYKEANEPLFLERNGIKFAFLAYVFIYSASTMRATLHSAGVADYRIKKILPVIRDLANSGYQVIVSLHWGMEYYLYPIPYQMNQARQMIDNGASIILGHGPHYPQGIEQYKKGRIIYSMGNFIFDEPYKFTKRSFIYGFGFVNTELVKEEEIYPVHLNNHVPQIVSGIKKERLEKLIFSLSTAYTKKKPDFWRKINSIYFSDLISRVKRMKSFKFLSLPSFSFYMNIGIRNYFKKIKSFIK